MNNLDILIKGIDVITADGACNVLKNVDIGIKNSYIEFIRPSGIVGNGCTADKVIEGKHRLAMPGLVNAHTHCGMTILRNAADDLPLEKWLFERIFPIEAKLTDDDIYWGTKLGIVEMLKSGTTAFADMYLHMDVVARAVHEAGIRANLSKSPLDFKSEKELEAIDVAEECCKYYKSWHGKGNGRIKVYVEVHSTYLFNRETLKDSSMLAKQLGTGIQIHISETEKEREESFKNYGMSPAEVCAETGIFDVPVVAAHCVHLSEKDMNILKDKNVNVAHNPTSNLKLGSGIARIPEMMDMGINISLGTDGTASNNNLNMFEEMHLAALLHKGVNKNPELVKAEQAILMATANGAKAIGFGDDTGIIKAGMKADIILLDTDKPHFYPMNDICSAMAYSAQGADVDTVIVDGTVLMQNREMAVIDEERIKFEVNRIAAAIFK